MSMRSIWALAGGRGGAGRTLLTANLGIQLARAGRTVVLVDLDPQGGSLHSALGYARVRRGLAELATGGSDARLADLVVDTSINHLRLLCGLIAGAPPADPMAFVERVGEGLADLGSEFVILDCGSGRSPATLAAFGLASLGILVTTPEPQALESAGVFVEAHLRRCLERALPADTRRALHELLAADGQSPERLTFRTLMIRLAALDTAARDAVAEVIRRTRLELLLNQVREEADEESGAALASGIRKVFGLELPIAGLVEHDPSVLQAIHKRRPLSQQFPNTPATKGIGRAADRLLAASGEKAPPPAEEWEDLSGVDYYRVLEIVPKASSREIQSAYHVLKRAYDAEVSPLAPLLDAERLRVLQGRVEEAYRTLIFLESRVAYDRHLLDSGLLKPDQIRGLHAELAHAAPAPTSGPAAAASSGEGAGFGPTAGDDPAAATAAVPAAASTLPADEGEPAPAESGAPTAAVTPVSTASSAPAVTTPAAGDASQAPRSLPATGEALRAERLRLGQTLEAIVSRTKIRQTYLQAIEEERYEALPPPVFLRGFVREFAACLGLPAEEVARAFLKRREQALSSAEPAPDPARRSA
jgi:flagellar biosynthesis protein FlhG